MKNTINNQTGSALAMALLIFVMIFGIVTAYFTLSVGGYETSTRELAGVEARMAAEDGLTLSIAEIKSQIDPDADGLGNITATAPDGRSVSVIAFHTAPTIWEIHSVAVLKRARCGADIVAEIYPSQPINIAPRAGFTTRSSVTTTGGITIDGRDWNLAGTAVIGPGTYGISSVGQVSNSGSSKVGGNGIAPARPPPPGTQQSFASWADGINQDGDAATDEEAFDGIDNDGDGQIDEDTNSYPTGPDIALHFPDNTLKESAIYLGTYYTSQAQIAAAIAANGNRLPGGAVIYCDFPTWNPADLGAAFNDPPSLLVHHTSTGTAQMQNVHGVFKGLMMVDTLDHLNAGVIVLGGVMSFAPESATNAIGNGNAYIRYCSGVTLNLPTVGDLAVRIRSWHRATPQ